MCEFFFFMEKSCSVLEIFNFYILNHSINLKSCDGMMSISMRGRVHLRIYDLYIIMSNILRKFFSWFGGLGPKSNRFLINHTTLINQKSIMMGLFFLLFWRFALSQPKIVKEVTVHIHYVYSFYVPYYSPQEAVWRGVLYSERKLI